jgi:hypothetical protein
VVGERTRLVAVTAASNLLGTKPPVNQIARRAHQVGALVYVDGGALHRPRSGRHLRPGRRLLRLLPLQILRAALRRPGRRSGAARNTQLGQAAALDKRRPRAVPTIGFLTFRDKDAADAYRFLAARDILAPSGTSYAYEPFRALNLEVDAGVRVGLAPTTTTSRSTACSAPLRSTCTRIDRNS